MWALLAAMPRFVNADVVTFDDLPDSNIPRPYHGLVFINLSATKVSGAPYFGYEPCSEPRAADMGSNPNGWMTSRYELLNMHGRLFDFTGACFSAYAGHWAPTHLTIDGYRRGVHVWSDTIPLLTTGMVHHGFRFFGVDTVIFTPSPYTVGGYTLMDSIDVSWSRSPTVFPLLLDSTLQ
jgi:hypothetical protein